MGGTREHITEEALHQLLHVHVPLVVYIGNQRRILGEAVVTGDGIEAYIAEENHGDAVRFLVEMITHGVIQNVSVTFNAPPAIPVYKDGNITWVKNY
jgi:hypothetical protein